MTTNKQCKYDAWTLCEFSGEVPDDKECLACCLHILLTCLSREDLALAGYQMRTLNAILEKLGYIVPKPIESRKSNNPLVR